VSNTWNLANAVRKVEFKLLHIRQTGTKLEQIAKAARVELIRCGCN